MLRPGGGGSEAESGCGSPDAREAELPGRRPGDVAGGVLVPTGFGEAATSGRPVKVEALRDPHREIGGQVATAVAASVGNRVSAVGLSVRVGSEITGRSPGELLGPAGDRPAPFELDEGGDTGRSINASAFFGASMAIVFSSSASPTRPGA